MLRPKQSGKRKKTKRKSQMKLSSKKLHHSFEGFLPENSSSWLYHIELMLSAISMILLVVVYIGMVFGVAYGIYWHITFHHSFIIVYDATYLDFLSYIIPIILGSVLFFVMTKPLFFDEIIVAQSIKLDLQDAPLLSDLIHEVCQRINAPIPEEIELNNELDVSFELKDRFLGVFGGKLILTLGLPLIAGLNISQFSGVLAHELGQVSQTSTLFLSNIIRTINILFAQMFLSLHEFERYLIESSDHFIISALLFIVRLFVWLVRFILFILTSIAGLCSYFILRQMKYDADFYKIHLIGSDTFAETLVQIRLLEFAYQSAYSDLQSSWNDGRLGDNLAQLVFEKSKEISDDVRDLIDEAINQEKTHFWDIHPCDKDRIKRAKEINSIGIVHLNKPTTLLFHDFKSLSKKVTYHTYKKLLQLDVKYQNLISTKELLQQQKEQSNFSLALEHYFQGLLRLDHFISLSRQSLPVVDNERELTEKIDILRTDINVSLGLSRDSYHVYIEKSNKLEDLLFVEKTIHFYADHLEDEEDQTSLESTQQQIKELRKEIKPVEELLLSFEEKTITRLLLALASLLNEQLRNKLGKTIETFERVEELLNAFKGLSKVYDKIKSLHKQHFYQTIFFNNISTNVIQEDVLYAFIEETNEKLYDNLINIRSSLSFENYPFDHANQFITMGKYIVQHQIEEKEDLNNVFLISQDVISRFFSLYFRMLGELTFMAEEIELALGFDPMPTPTEDFAGHWTTYFVEQQLEE